MNIDTEAQKLTNIKFDKKIGGLFFNKSFVYSVWSVLIFLSNIPAFAQGDRIDSLLAKIAERDITIESRISYYSEIGGAYTYSNTDSAIYYYTMAINLSHRNGLDSLFPDINRLIGRAYYVKGDYITAYTYVNKAWELAGALQDSQRIANSLNTLGAITFMLNEKQKAISQHKASIKIFESLQDTIGLCNNFLNLSIVYQSTGQLDSALYFIKKTLSYTNSIGNRNFLPITYGRYGEILFDLKKYNQAGEAFQAGLENENITNWDRGFNLTGLANVKLKLGDYKSALEFAERGLKYSLEVSSYYGIQRAYEVMAESQEKLGNYQEANAFNKLFKVYSDSLFNTEKDKDIRYRMFKDQELKNTLLLKENENAKSQLDLKSLQLVIMGIVMVGFMVVLIIGLISRKSNKRLVASLSESNKDIKRKKQEIIKRNEELQSLHETKDKLFSIISHDMKSPIASLQSVMELGALGDLSAQELQELMKSLSGSVRAVQEMLNNLLHWAQNNLKDVTPDASEVQISQVIEKEIIPWIPTAKAKDIEILHEKNEKITVYLDPVHLGIIIRNLIGNSIKFTSNKGCIRIYYYKYENEVEIIVEDNGVGMTQEKLDNLFIVYGKEISGYGTQNESGTGIGLNLVYEFVKLNHGKITVNSKVGVGTSIKIIFPVKSPD